MAQCGHSGYQDGVDQRCPDTNDVRLTCLRSRYEAAGEVMLEMVYRGLDVRSLAATVYEHKTRLRSSALAQFYGQSTN